MAAIPANQARTAAYALFPILAACLAAALAGCEGAIDNGGGIDDNAPEVVSTQPADGGVWPPDQTLSVQFNEEITLESAQSGIALIGFDVNVELDPTARTARIDPIEPLPSGASITLSIRRIEDLAGNAMTNIVTVNFTVE